MKRKTGLGTHFDVLREMIPEVYTHPSFQEEAAENNPMFKLVKRTLSIIEALYLQDSSMLRPASVEEYARIIHELKNMGYHYPGNHQLMDQAAGQLIIGTRKPMEKATGKSKVISEEERKAI